MIYPVSLVGFQDEVSLYMPDPTQIKSVYENLYAADQSTPFPFWAKIWPSSIAMASFLKSEPSLIQSKRVLEIGAGIGLPSFSIESYVSELIITDNTADAIELIDKNIAHLSLHHAKARYLDWNSLPEDIFADVVLLSDVNYNPAEFNSLLDIVQRFILDGATVVIATPQRIMTNPFVDLIKPFIRRSLVIPIQEMDQVVDIGVLVLSP
jgi:predicted nicotinamide N-methyase